MRINPKKNITTWGSLVPGASMKRPGVPYAELYRRRFAAIDKAKSALLYARVVVPVADVQKMQRMSKKEKRRLFLAEMREDLNFLPAATVIRRILGPHVREDKKNEKPTVTVTFPKVKGAKGYRLYRRMS